MQIVVKPIVIQKLDNLFIALLEEGYFSDPAYAHSYKSKLEDFIRNIPAVTHRLTSNKRWGEYFTTYKANRRTTWYILFDKENNEQGSLHIVRNIINNHTEEYPRFIAGIK